MARPKWQREGLGEEFKGNLKADRRRREGLEEEFESNFKGIRKRARNGAGAV